MELWYTEKQTENFEIIAKIHETLVAEKTEFQDLAIVDTVEFGHIGGWIYAYYQQHNEKGEIPNRLSSS